MVHLIILLKNNYKELSIHERNVQSLMLLIYRIINNLSPKLIAERFKEKNTKYSLRSKSTLQLPKTCKTTRFGTNSIVFKGSLLWNGIPNTYKEIKTEKEKIKK